ncbi:GNAT family N-acetyltransferase [Paenibacillus sp. MMS20-IR301]|uniref:GNAT family N-acetyltransferase n=1 Tax=Paenibacillus sp. MMS20-IR301 TaxID=2895946 RepID=UPI0028E86A22|nr:GNAT family N-acetyltransferase [Paenibacillus sp. MMS20-IR301]WNS42952.1 GNAT family N-acetyltransferase [Paenibacillus sp. MMS20-IR301]
MLISLRNYWDSDAITGLLAECMWTGNHRAEEELKRYRAADGCELFGCFVGGELAGILGVHCPVRPEVEIRHLAVKKEWRGRGLGRAMIAEVAAKDSIGLIRAETDQEAVGFYRSTGFEISSLGEKYPGVERFECVRYTGDEGRA